MANQQSSQPKQAGKTKGKSGGRGPQFQKEVKLNKRQETGRSPERGPGSKKIMSGKSVTGQETNLTAKCKKCGMYIQQVDKPANFEEKNHAPMLECGLQAPRRPISTLLTNPATVGVAWVCLGCGGCAKHRRCCALKAWSSPARQAREIKSQECLKWRQQHRPPLAKAFPSLVRLLFSKIMQPATSF